MNRSWKYCVQFVKSFHLRRYAEERVKHLRLSGSRPGWLAMGCLSKLSDSAVDGGIICSSGKDELQQIVWNRRDFLSSWLMGRPRKQNNPPTSAVGMKSSMGKIPCLLGHTIPPLPLLLKLFWEWTWYFFFDLCCLIYTILVLWSSTDYIKSFSQVLTLTTRQHLD